MPGRAFFIFGIVQNIPVYGIIDAYLYQRNEINESKRIFHAKNRPFFRLAQIVSPVLSIVSACGTKTDIDYCFDVEKGKDGYMDSCFEWEICGLCKHDERRKGDHDRLSGR